MSTFPVDTCAAALLALLLAVQWRWYYAAALAAATGGPRGAPRLRSGRLVGIIDRAPLAHADLTSFARLGRERRPEAPKARGAARPPPPPPRLTPAASRAPPQLLAPPPARKLHVVVTTTTNMGDAKRRMILVLRQAAVASAAKRDARLGRTAAEVAAERAAITAHVSKYVARRRAVNLLHALAADAHKARSLDTSVRALDAMRRLSQYDSSSFMVVEHGGMGAALEAMGNWPESAAVQWHAATLFGNLGLSLVLLVRLHLHPEVKHGRTSLLIIRALRTFPNDVRVQGAAAGALWALVMATGAAGQEAAIRGGALPLLVAAVRAHPSSGIVVYNAAGALLLSAQGFPGVQGVLQGDGSTAVVRAAVEAHGGLEALYGTAVAANASWLGADAPQVPPPAAGAAGGGHAAAGAGNSGGGGSAAAALASGHSARLPGRREYIYDELFHQPEDAPSALALRVAATPRFLTADGGALRARQPAPQAKPAKAALR